MADRGHLIIISGPSGVGKGTICQRILKSRADLIKSISVTTRKPRGSEKDGVEYFFKSTEEYQMIKANGGFLETFTIYGNYYGTPADFVLGSINKGINVLLEIDVQGALAVKEKMPEAKLIFIAPPSMEHLKQRLVGRNTEDQETINKRLRAAADELNNKDKYDFIVINDDLEGAVREINEILDNITNRR